MSAILPLIETQASTGGPGSADTTKLQAHFPEAPTLPGTYSIKDPEYRKAALKLLLSDDSVSVPTNGRENDYAKSIWITAGSTYKRNFAENGAPEYSKVPLVAGVGGDGYPETPYYPNLGSAADADPANLPAVTANSAPTATNSLASILTAGTTGDVTQRDPKAISNGGAVTDSSFTGENNQLVLTPGSSRWSS